MTTKNETQIKAEPGKQELFIIREFEAPRQLVYDAYTNPEIYIKLTPCAPITHHNCVPNYSTQTGFPYRISATSAGNAMGFSKQFRDFLESFLNWLRRNGRRAPVRPRDSRALPPRRDAAAPIPDTLRWPWRHRRAAGPQQRREITLPRPAPAPTSLHHVSTT